MFINFTLVQSEGLTLCWDSRCLLKSTFLWNARSQQSQANGLYPVCFLMWVIRFELWLKAFSQILHLWGFSPKQGSLRWNKIRFSIRIVTYWFFSSLIFNLISSCLCKLFFFFLELNVARSIGFLLPVWMKVCFFISDFWWNLFPQ